MSKAIIQVQDVGGNWFTVACIDVISDQYMTTRMKQVKGSYVNKRVRAVNPKGQLLDLME